MPPKVRPRAIQGRWSALQSAAQAADKRVHDRAPLALLYLQSLRKYRRDWLPGALQRHIVVAREAGPRDPTSACEERSRLQRQPRSPRESGKAEPHTLRAAVP